MILMSRVNLKSKLTLFDVTNLVVGGIIGADIYVASAFGAGLLGPFSLIVWVVAGFMAIVIALCFAQCAALLPKVGGPYAYAHAAWGTFAGFIVGWSLWLAEWMSLAVFPVAFTQYLMFFLPGLDLISQVIVKVLFVVFLIVTNVGGVKAAGRINDVLTLVKLAPLIFFTVVGLLYMGSNMTTVNMNFSPFLPYGFGNFGAALVLIFWAYAGFEISTIPAEEIRDPSRTIPRAIILGISIVTIFYLTTNIVLFGVRRWDWLQNDNAPLATATGMALGSIPALALIGGTIVGGGALISVTGSDESGMIGTSRLGYALAVDGLFPSIFAKVHPRFKTPYLGIIIQGITALIASIVGELSLLVATSVVLLSVVYIATSASVFSLRKKRLKPKFSVGGGFIIPILGLIFSTYLITQCTIQQVSIASLLLLLGVPIYIKYTPKKELTELEEVLTSRELLQESLYKQEKFLAYLLRQVWKIFHRIKKKGTKI